MKIDFNHIISLEEKKELRFENYKISYLLLKPNAAKHYNIILEEIQKNQYEIVSQYAVFDYEKVNMALHMGQIESMKYIIPISRMFYDFYGNYGIVIMIAKKDISYENFCLQVVGLKKSLRDRFKLPYLSYIFDMSELGSKNEKQKLILLSKNGDKLAKDEMNHEGTFMVFSMNEVHSPDNSIETTLSELKLLEAMGIFDQNNVLSRSEIHSIERYKTFEFLKDML